MTVKQLNENLGEVNGIPEIAWWWAFDGIEPMGDPCLENARLCSFIAAANGAKVSVDDLYPARIKPEREQTADQMRLQMERNALGSGFRVINATAPK